MSTISDALKKAQKQRMGRPSAPVTLPKVPPLDDMKEKSKPEPVRERSTGNPSFLLILICVATVAVGFFYYLRNTRVDLHITELSPASAVHPEVPVVASEPVAVVKPITPVSVGETTSAEMVVSQPIRQKVARTDTPVLGGIFFSEKNPVAIINGSAMKEGEMIGAYQVVKILTYSVTLKCDGEEIELRLR
jgi:hypothetical protein